MQLEWLGQYRPFVEKMIRYGNSYSQFNKISREIAPSFCFSASQIQVVEYILENEELNLNMVQTSSRLGISSSAFTKIVQRLVAMGFLEKYHISGNRKDVIIRVSPLGREAYGLWVNFIYENFFHRIFDVLDDIPAEYVEKFTKVMELASNSIFDPNAEPQTATPTLIKIE